MAERVKTEPPLPGILAEIEEVVGRDAALDLALAFGGQPLHVPSPNNIQVSRLGRALGEQRARIFAEHFRGEQIYIPQARRYVIRHLRSRGSSTGEIAARLRVSRRTVERLSR